MVDLADDTARDVFTADPQAALRAVGEPVLLDEWQLVPGLAAAVKREVDLWGGTGRFLLAGSVSPDSLKDKWPFTGRVLSLSMEPMVGREIVGHVSSQPFVERLAKADVKLLAPPDRARFGQFDLDDYLRLAIVGGLPRSVLAKTEQTRSKWIADSYLEGLLGQEARWLGQVPEPGRFHRYLQVMANYSGRVAKDTSLYEAAEISRATALRYDQLLERLFVTGDVPAWSANRLKRLVKMPKRFLRDSSLMPAILGLSLGDFMRDGKLVGQLLETFVAAQIRAELATIPRPPRMYHLRDGNGDREVDLILEFPNGGVVGIEVKAGGLARSGDAKHLMWLRDQLGAKFICGVVLHTGMINEPLDDRIIGAPISTIWMWDPVSLGESIYQVGQSRVRGLGAPTPDGEFIVFAGSVGQRGLLSSVEGEATGHKIERRRDDLLKRGVIASLDSRTFVFKRNWVFNAPSPPAELLFGGARSGPDVWANLETGLTLAGKKPGQRTKQTGGDAPVIGAGD